MFDLLYMGELAAKLAIVGLVACVDEDRDRHRYRVERSLVRANGIGDWTKSLTDLLVGPASQHLSDAATAIRRELMQNFSRGDDAWQRRVLDDLNAVCAVLGDDYSPLAAKASLRWWFDTFAWLRNRTRGHGAVRSADCAKICAPLERSLRILTSNLAIYQLPWAYLHQNLSGKYRIIPVTPDSSSFSFLKSEKTHTFPDGLYLYLAEVRKVPLVSTDLDLSDFYFANGNFKDTGKKVTYEALSYTSDNRVTLDGSDYIALSTPYPPSETEGRPALEVQGQSFGNIPPKTLDYVPRAELEGELRDVLLNDRHPVVTLIGRGGIGKTSLALEVTHQIAETGDFFAVLWFSARDIDLLSEGPKLVLPKVRTVDEVATEFTRLMAPERAGQSGFNSLDYLTRTMRTNESGRLLFVFDNFETMQSPAELFQLIDTYIRLPNKILITSRHREFKADYPVQVGGMRRAEFDELVRMTAVKLNISHLLSARYLDELFDESDGHPYGLNEVSGGRVGL